MLTAEEHARLLQQVREGQLSDASRVRDLVLDLAQIVQAARTMADKALFELDCGRWQNCRKTLELIQRIE